MADTTTAPETTQTAAPPAIVLDFGKKSRKAVKRLRKGKGKLVDKVEAAVQNLRAAGSIAPDAQTVIVVVREKDELRLW
ncbi:MAG: hypothetical protein AB7N76_23650 [Planctomycetota bacterium]